MIEIGDYLVIDDKDFGAWASRHGIRIDNLQEKDTVQPSYIQPTYRAKGMTFPEMKSRTWWVKKHREPARLHISGGAFPLNVVRIPPEDAKAFFKECDAKIEDLERQIKEIREKKVLFAKEHYLEWEMAKTEDFPQGMIREPTIQTYPPQW